MLAPVISSASAAKKQVDDANLAIFSADGRQTRVVYFVTECFKVAFKCNV
jgi:hypothetical protein